MRLPQPSDRFVLAANDGEVDFPPVVEVRSTSVTRPIRYTLTGVVGSCDKGRNSSHAVAVDDLPAELVVEEDVLPDRFSLGLVNAGPCDLHGWDCPHWVHSAVYVRN